MSHRTIRRGWLLLLVSLGLPVAGCSDERDDGGGAPAAECPGHLDPAFCIKACGLAVETEATQGFQYVLRTDQGQEQPVSSLTATYQVTTFSLSGPGPLFLELPRQVLTELHAERVTFPHCITLGSRGGDVGFGQYLPKSTYSTDAQRTGTVALLRFATGTGDIEGIFEFDAALNTGGGAAEDAQVIHIVQGYFYAGPSS